jgi:hypothetical protein
LLNRLKQLFGNLKKTQAFEFIPAQLRFLNFTLMKLVRDRQETIGATLKAIALPTIQLLSNAIFHIVNSMKWVCFGNMNHEGSSQ